MYYRIYGFPVWQTVVMARTGPTPSFHPTTLGSNWGSLRVSF